MSVASEIRTALASTGYPIEQGLYTGGATTYITFNLSTLPDLYGDNEPGFERYLIQIHLIAPATTDTTATQATIKSLLVAGGFDYPSTINASDDPAEQHIVFETGTAVYIGA